MKRIKEMNIGISYGNTWDDLVSVLRDYPTCTLMHLQSGEGRYATLTGPMDAKPSGQWISFGLSGNQAFIQKADFSNVVVSDYISGQVEVNVYTRDFLTYKFWLK